MDIDSPLDPEPIEFCPNCHGVGSFIDPDVSDAVACMTCGGEGIVLARHYHQIKAAIEKQRDASRQ